MGWLLKQDEDSYQRDVGVLYQELINLVEKVDTADLAALGLSLDTDDV